MAQDSNKNDSKAQTKILKRDWKKDVVYLYQFARSPFLPNLSPFCLKVEAYLRLYQIEYEVVSTFYGRSQKGRLPFIELNGEQIADSQFIIFHLEKHFQIKVTHRLKIEGTAMYSEKEILSILRIDLLAVDTLLGNNEFFFGDKPSLLDVTMFGHLAAIYYVPFQHPSKELVATEFPRILNHTERMAKRLFSDFKFGQETTRF